jgi:hypothetical protein
MSTKYTIPGGYDFAEGIRTGHATAFFAWLTDNNVDPSVIDPMRDVVIAHDATTSASITADTLEGQRGTWPLTPVPEAVAEWLATEFGVKAAPVDDIAVRLDKLRDARQRAQAAKDEADELRAEILAILTVRKATVGTISGVPVIGIKKIPMPGRLDRKGLEAEYPTIVARFVGPETTQTRLEFL